MSPVLTPTLLDPIAETLELSETELGRLFGVSRQAVGQWRERGVPSNRMAKVTTVAAICDLLQHQTGARSGHRPPARPRLRRPLDAGDDRARPAGPAAVEGPSVLRLGGVGLVAHDPPWRSLPAGR